MTSKYASTVMGCEMMPVFQTLAEALFDERPASNRFKGTNGKPKHTKRSTVVNAGSPTSQKAQGDGAAIVAKCSG